MKTIKYFINIFTAVVILASVSAKAQEKPDTSNAGHKMMMKHDHQKMHNMVHDSSEQHNMHDMTMMKDSSHHKMMNNNEMTSSKKSPLIREGVIDLEAIDKNKDGKVYEDMMDYNVISDKPGICPLCGMTLKEVSIKKARQNLKANGFKVK